MGSSDTQSIEPEPRAGGSGKSHPFLHLVLRADEPLQLGGRWWLGSLERIDLGRGPDRDARRDGRVLSMELGDRGVSLRHAQMLKAGARWRIEDLQSKNGTWVNGQRVQGAPLSDGDLLELGHTFFLFREEKSSFEAPAFLETAQVRPPAPGLATMAPALAEEFSRLASIAPTRITIVLAGETGTGKEVIAAAAHKLSGRAGEFQAVNCGALPANLVESELFGYRKGAFSGALEDRPGLVRSADRGTLFLDELGDLPLPAQVSFLRVLQESEVVPVGGARPVKVDLRLIVATHRDLDELVAKGQFRADLLARVSGFLLTLPPLRERREDLGLLIASLIERHCPKRADGLRFTPDAARAILLHRWPLNIRELEKCLATALALSPSRVELSHLTREVRGALDHPIARPAAISEPDLSEADRERRAQLVALLREHHGNVTAVASAMGKFRNQINRWLKRLRIDPAEYR